jgi:hypothetical protein
VDKQDPLLNLWILAWEAHQLVRSPVHVFDANIFYPFRHTLAYSETLFSTSGLVFPLMLAPDTRILGYNLAFLSTFILSALGAYLLTFYLTGRRLAGAIAGLVFAFAPYRFGHLSQIQLLSAQWFPFVILSFDRLLRAGTASVRSRRPGRPLALFVVFFVLQCLASFYYAFQVALLVALYALTFLLAHRKQFTWRTLRYLILAGAISAVLILPAALPYLSVQKELHAGWSLKNNETFSASLQAYLYTAESNPLWGGLAARLSYVYGPCCPPDTLFPGLLTTLLAVLGIAHWRRRPRRGGPSLQQGFYLLLLVSAFVLSLGPSLHVWANEVVPLPFSLPYAWLYRAVPLFRAMRAPVRFANLVVLAVAALAGYGSAAVLSRLSRRMALVATIGLAGVLLAEYSAVPVESVAIPGPEQVPPVYRWLAEQHPTVILELPLASKLPTPHLAKPVDPRRAWATSRLLEHQYFSTFHWHTTPDGYSGFIPPRHGEMVYEMERFPSARSVAVLQALDVQWLILHRDDFDPQRWAAIQDALPRYSALQPVKVFGGDYVFRVLPPAEPVPPAGVRGYLPPTGQAGHPYTVYVVLQPSDDRPLAAKPTERVPVRAEWTDAQGSTIVQESSFTLPLVNSGAEVRAIALTAPMRPGQYGLTLSGGKNIVTAFRLTRTVTVGDQPTGGGRPVPVRLALASALPGVTEGGHTLRVHLRWQALGKINEYDSAFVRLVDGQGRTLAQLDHGAGGSENPTLLWVPGDTISDTFDVAIPADARPGLYRLEAGLYQPEGVLPRLLISEDGSLTRVVLLGTIRVVEVAP